VGGGGEVLARRNVVVILGLEEEDGHLRVLDGLDHARSQLEGVLPILRGARKIHGGAHAETFLRHQNRLNSSEGAARHGDPPRVDIGQSFQIGERSHLILQMLFH